MSHRRDGSEDPSKFDRYAYLANRTVFGYVNLLRDTPVVDIFLLFLGGGCFLGAAWLEALCIREAYDYMPQQAKRFFTHRFVARFYIIKIMSHGASKRIYDVSCTIPCCVSGRCRIFHAIAKSLSCALLSLRLASL